MKKAVLNLFLFLLSGSLIKAQNIGIGTPAPTGKLQVNHRSSDAVGLRLVDSSANSAGTVEFRNVNNTKRMLVAGYTESDFSLGQYIDVTSDSLFIATFRGSGMVGIRNGGPQYPLDVNGDINTNGAVRVNGNAGNNGQILRSNGDGTMSWGDMCEFKNYEVYRTTGAATWIVPAGVTKIYVELWGAGGGGAIYGGGGGGAYIKAYFAVTPGSSVSYSIGVGGSGGSFAGSSANSGISSTATVGSVTITAGGGGGSSSAIAGEQPGSGGGYSVTAGFRNYVGIDGENGSHNQTIYQQKNATTYVINTRYGSGGNAGNAQNTAGLGNYTIVNESTAVIIKESYALAPNIPGGGGGTFYCSICTSHAGANGQMIIHY